MEKSYYTKYLKYKQKYLNLLEHLGGGDRYYNSYDNTLLFNAIAKTNPYAN